MGRMRVGILLLVGVVPVWAQAPTVESLCADLKSDNYEVRDVARDELAKRGEPAVRPLLKFIGEENVLAFREALQIAAMDKPSESGQHKSEARRHDENLTRALFVLTRIGKPAVEPLLALLKDESGLARRYKALVIESLGEIGDQRAVGPIITEMRAYSELSSDLIYKVTEYSAQALYKLTGRAFGTDVKQWEAWWAQNKAKKEAPKTEAPQ